MNFFDIVLCGTLFATLLGCTESQLPDGASENLQLNPELVDVEAGPFEPPRSWDFFRNGRPENAYILAYSRNDEICSALTLALNKSRKTPGKDQNLSSLGYSAHIADVLLGSDLSVSWTELNDTISLSYSELDLDADGKLDYIIRATNNQDSSRYPMSQPISIAPTRLVSEKDQSKFFVKSAYYQALQSNLRSLEINPQLGYYGIPVTFDDSTIDINPPIPSNDKRVLEFGQLREAVNIQGQGFLLVGGIIEPKLVELSLDTPVRLVKIVNKISFDQEEQLKMALICSLRSRFKLTQQ